MKRIQSPAHDPWSVVQWPTPRSADWTRALTSDENISALIAIGSAARGRARPGSDLDLIIVCRDKTKRRAAPPEVDTRWIELARLRRSVERGDDVVAWGVAFGLALHDPDGTWLGVVTEHRYHLSLPSPAVCLLRARRASRYAEELLQCGDEDAAAEQVLTMLTHLARQVLSKAGVFPASRPELAQQLEDIEEMELAELLSCALRGDTDVARALELSGALLKPEQSLPPPRSFSLQ